MKTVVCYISGHGFGHAVRIANGTPILHTWRKRFAEYSCLVEGVEADLPLDVLGWLHVELV